VAQVFIDTVVKLHGMRTPSSLTAIAYSQAPYGRCCFNSWALHTIRRQIS
jgi:hypothetical protein